MTRPSGHVSTPTEHLLVRLDSGAGCDDPNAQAPASHDVFGMGGRKILREIGRPW